MKQEEKKNIYVTKPNLPSMEAYIAEIAEIWDTHYLTNFGTKHQQLEAQLQKYMQVSHTVLCSNGHMALELALSALGMQGEIITTPFSFISTTHAIVRSNNTPVFCDICAEDYTMDATKIEDCMTEKTIAILPVHVYGHICDVEAIERIAQKYGVAVIYDAAHAFGIRKNGRGIASYGDASTFSFHATKVFHTIEGGCICTQNDALARRLCAMRNFGLSDSEHASYVAPNAKMNEFQAAMGICNLRMVEDTIQKRKKLYMTYYENLQGIAGITLPNLQKNIEYNYAYFPILFDAEQFGKSRDEICIELQKHNVYARKYFYPLITEHTCYQAYAAQYDTPIAKKVSSQVLTLPLYPDLAQEDALFICKIIRNIKE